MVRIFRCQSFNKVKTCRFDIIKKYINKDNLIIKFYLWAGGRISSENRV